MSTTTDPVSPLVIKIGGAGVDDPHAQAPLWRAVLEAHRILQGHLVLVHGGGRAVDAHLERLGMKTERIEGLRVTPKEQMPEITAVLAGRVNKALVGAINAQGNDTPAVGLSLGDGGTLPAKITRSPGGHDLGRVGRPLSGEASLVRLLMAYRYLPVICSIGFDEHGEALNLNADDAAAGLAQALHARTLVLLTDVPAVLDDENRPIATLSHAESEALIARGTISGGMVPKVRAALNAARNARTPASIASWNRPEDLIRIARGESAGTSVLPT